MDIVNDIINAVRDRQIKGGMQPDFISMTEKTLDIMIHYFNDKMMSKHKERLKTSSFPDIEKKHKPEPVKWSNGELISFLGIPITIIEHQDKLFILKPKQEI